MSSNNSAAQNISPKRTQKDPDTETWDPESLKARSQTDTTTTVILNEGRLKAELDSDGSYLNLLEKLRKEGEILRSDNDQPKLSMKPTWFDETLFKNAQSVYRRHFMGVNFAHLSGLLLLVRVDSIYRTLSSTGESDTVAKLFRRYYHTLRHVKTWYESDIFEEGSDAFRSLLIVRGMHNKVSVKLNDIKLNENDRIKQSDAAAIATISKTNQTSHSQSAQLAGDTNEFVHISHYDIMLTQFAFVGLIVTRGKNMGLIDDFNRKDIDSILHFWRIIGHYLGVSEKLNLCSYELRDIVGLCEAIIEIEYKASIRKNPLHGPPGIMSVNIVRSLKFIPMLTIYGMMRYLYELLGESLDELESKRNWYSNLSYTFIKLVMTNLLGYKPLRSFNNGLTRLSVYLTGKIEDWFAGRLESNYGQELRV